MLNITGFVKICSWISLLTKELVIAYVHCSLLHGSIRSFKKKLFNVSVNIRFPNHSSGHAFMESIFTTGNMFVYRTMPNDI